MAGDHAGGLQRYLWYDLPRRHAGDTWRPVAEAAGVLLWLPGLDRYAAIARSVTTTAVLDAWEEATGKGFAAFRAASRALAPAGRTAAIALLRARATAPGRRSTFGLG